MRGESIGLYGGCQVASGMRWILLLVLLPAASAETLFLQGDSGTGVIGEGPWLRDEPGSGSQTVTMSPALAGLGQGSDTIAWTWDQTWDMDMAFQGNLRLQLPIQSAGTGDLVVTIQDLSPEGEARDLASKRVSLRPADSGSSLTVEVPTAGAIATQGHTLRLHLLAIGTGQTLVEYNTAASRITFSTQASDLDGDGVPDSAERAAGTDPRDPADPGDGMHDTDQDGLSDRFEAMLGTDMRNGDTDADGVLDGIEFHAGTDPLDGADRPRDDDGDGLPDGWERRFFGDLTEAGSGDPDEDGLSNTLEAAYGTDPRAKDSDGDGVSDGDEVKAGRDPTMDPDAVAPAVRQGVELVAGLLLVAATGAVVWIGLARRHAL